MDHCFQISWDSHRTKFKRLMMAGLESSTYDGGSALRGRPSRKCPEASVVDSSGVESSGRSGQELRTTSTSLRIRAVTNYLKTG